jgi:hypothetical protein
MNQPIVINTFSIKTQQTKLFLGRAEPRLKKKLIFIVGYLL